MRKLEEFVNEKLRVSKDNVTPDISLGKQGWECTSVFSMYTEIWQVDDFLKMNIDLEGLSSISTEEYTENTDIMRDKVFQALKRFKWCKKIINVILSECTFDDGIEKVQETLRNNAKCEPAKYKYDQSSIGVKRQVIRILDSHNRSAMILSFNKL